MTSPTTHWIRLLGAIAPTAAARLECRRLMRPVTHPPQDWEYAARHTARSIVFRNGTAGLRWGGEGPIVLMLHGWEGRPTQFARFLPALLASGRQAISLWAPAHGDSPGRDAGISSFTRALQEVIAEIGSVDALVGHSMGGSAALFAVARGAQAKRVVSLAAPSAFSDVLDRHARARAMSARMRRAFLRVADQRVGEPARRLDVAEAVRGLELPVLLVHDRGDAIAPFADAGRIATALPQSRLIATDGLDHGRLLLDRRVVASVCDFLSPLPRFTMPPQKIALHSR